MSRLTRYFIAAFCSFMAALCVVIPSAPAGAAGQPPGPRDDLIQQINTLQRAQQRDGSLEFKGANKFFESYPVLATLAIDLSGSDPDPAFISRFLSSVTRYYGYLFTNRDRNGNLMIETRLLSPDGAVRTGIEDPGFNGLLSLDMINVARLNLEIRKPMEALYWYEGARTLQNEIANRCFDPESGYFFPFDTNSGVMLREHFALSAIPLLFTGEVGDNHAGTLIHYYALRDPGVSPEPPFLYVEHPAAARPDGESLLFHPEYLLKSLITGEVLSARGNTAKARDARRMIAGIVAGQDPVPATGRQPAPSSRYLEYLLTGAAGWRFYQPLAAAELYESIVRTKRSLPDNELVRLHHNVATIREYLYSDGEGFELDLVENCIREVYGAVSTTRGQLKQKKLYDQDDSRRASGLDLASATARLLDDVVASMRLAENAVCAARCQQSGLQISVTLLRERALVDQSIEVKWVLESRGKKPIEIRSAQVIRGQEVDSLIGATNANVIAPGESRSFLSRFPARRGIPGTLIPWTFTLSLTTADGARFRYNAFRTLYLEQPLQAAASFPQGQILTGVSLPMELKFVKKTTTQAVIDCVWHSPAGIQLAEGNKFSINIPAELDTARVALNVLVPSPCRPGSFPFKMRFFAGGKDLGTINSSFFKPYQWLFLGPFEAAEHALSTPYPPEKVVDLQKEYLGIGKRISWQILPVTANYDYGEVHLQGVMKSRGVSYLYTVVESPVEKTNPLYFASNQPAAVFFNNERVMDYMPGPDRVAATDRVTVQRGMNNILIKIAGDSSARLYFKLGDDENIASDEFNNNLWELVGDFGEFQERSRRMNADDTAEVQKLVTLRYSDAAANSVAVIGTFNGWSPEHSHMRKSPGGGWEITLSLTPGKYAYRFLINNRKQILDPGCSREEPDGYGGKNSVLIVEK